MNESKKVRQVRMQRGEMLLDTIQNVEGIGRLCVAIRPLGSERDNCAAYVPLRDLVDLVERGFVNDEEIGEKRYGFYLLSWSVKDGRRKFDDWSYRGIVGEKRLRDNGIEIVE